MTRYLPQGRVTVRTFNPSQVRQLQEHLDAAAGLDAQERENIAALAVQLEGRSVLPLLGAGASYDCGLPLASCLGADLLADYLANTVYTPPANLRPDLGDVAEAIYVEAGQEAVVAALGLPDPALWPPAAEIGDHFCAYRVLARLAREGLFENAVTLNYDCNYEAALQREGFLLGRGTFPGRVWQDHVTLIADPQANNSVAVRGSLVFRKIHGCAARYREEATVDPGKAASRIVVRRSQLTNWRNDIWARDYLRQAAREHVLLLLGFSAQDPVIAGELVPLLADVFAEQTPNGQPRIVAVDYEPDTAALRALIHAGLGERAPASGMVAKVRTATSTTTAAVLVLLTETLAHRLAGPLASVGHSLPTDVDARMAAMTVSAPVMLRWSFLLRPPQRNCFLTRINLHTAAQRGYVPLLAEPETTALALRSRTRVRQAVGLGAVEGTREALSHHGFILEPAGGVAYLPTGLSFEALRGACRPGGQLEQARSTLDWPKHVDCIMIADDPSGRRGINLVTAREVKVP